MAAFTLKVLFGLGSLSSVAAAGTLMMTRSKRLQQERARLTDERHEIHTALQQERAVERASRSELESALQRQRRRTEVLQHLWTDRKDRLGDSLSKAESFIHAAPIASGALDRLTQHYGYLGAQLEQYRAFDLINLRIQLLGALTATTAAAATHRGASPLSDDTRVKNDNDHRVGPSSAPISSTTQPLSIERDDASAASLPSHIIDTNALRFFFSPKELLINGVADSIDEAATALCSPLTATTTSNPSSSPATAEANIPTLPELSTLFTQLTAEFHDAWTTELASIRKRQHDAIVTDAERRASADRLRLARENGLGGAARSDRPNASESTHSANDVVITDADVDRLLRPSLPAQAIRNPLRSMRTIGGDATASGGSNGEQASCQPATAATPPTPSPLSSGADVLKAVDYVQTLTSYVARSEEVAKPPPSARWPTLSLGRQQGGVFTAAASKPMPTPDAVSAAVESPRVRAALQSLRLWMKGANAYLVHEQGREVLQAYRACLLASVAQINQESATEGSASARQPKLPDTI
mgnify:FL=1